MKKIFVLFITIGFLTNGCSQNNEPEFEYKEWHSSPTRSPLSSTVYPFVDWEDVMGIKKGLTENDAEFGFQYYHHPVNAIIFTRSPQNVDYEIALKLSEDKNEVIDISYLELETNN